MGRAENIIVFEDTVERCRDSQRLMESIRESCDSQVVVLESAEVPDGRRRAQEQPRFSQPAQLVLTKERTFQAAEKYVRNPLYQDKRICVLNFASSMNPGGGVVRGASAQEESLCRCSTLYFCLDAVRDTFYLPHRKGLSFLHNDDVIYTPRVTVFKSDAAKPRPLAEKDWYQVDVISCAAPNLRSYFGHLLDDLGEMNPPAIEGAQLAAIHTQRVGRILDVAVQQEVDVLVLGAFGCGAFMNDPHVVAPVMVNLAREYASCFQTIEFAVYCSRWERENYHAFQQALEG